MKIKLGKIGLNLKESSSKKGDRRKSNKCDKKCVHPLSMGRSNTYSHDEEEGRRKRMKEVEEDGET